MLLLDGYGSSNGQSVGPPPLCTKISQQLVDKFEWNDI